MSKPCTTADSHKKIMSSISHAVLRLHHVYILFGSVYYPNVVHGLFSLVCHQLNSGTIVVALNISWNLIYWDKSLLRAEWLGSLQPLTGRRGSSRKITGQC